MKGAGSGGRGADAHPAACRVAEWPGPCPAQSGTTLWHCRWRQAAAAAGMEAVGRLRPSGKMLVPRDRCRAIDVMMGQACGGPAGLALSPHLEKAFQDMMQVWR